MGTASVSHATESGGGSFNAKSSSLPVAGGDSGVALGCHASEFGGGRSAAKSFVEILGCGEGFAGCCFVAEGAGPRWLRGGGICDVTGACGAAILIELRLSVNHLV